MKRSEGDVKRGDEERTGHRWSGRGGGRGGGERRSGVGGEEERKR